MNNIEKAMQAIQVEADKSGDKVIHIWSEDLEDGSANVKAIIMFANASKQITVGARVQL